MNPMFYLLLALIAVLAATANAGPVLDVNGNIIFGGSYYVLPFFFGPAGGGLTLVTPPGGNQCPLYIGQESSEVDKGTPVRFSNWMSKVRFVPESENLNIKMDAATICVQLTYWWVAPTDLTVMRFFVATGPNPTPGQESSRSFFQIKKFGDFSSVYKFSFCPENGGCYDVGITRDQNGVRRLVVGSEPFPFVFKKASETETSHKTMSII